MIIKNGKFVQGALKREGVTADEAEMAIREHGVNALEDVQLGVLEPDGTISIVPAPDATARKSRRKVRFLRRPN